jgi:hypothetical protein
MTGAKLRETIALVEDCDVFAVVAALGAGGGDDVVGGELGVEKVLLTLEVFGNAEQVWAVVADGIDDKVLAVAVPVIGAVGGIGGADVEAHHLDVGRRRC